MPMRRGVVAEQIKTVFGSSKGKPSTLPPTRRILTTNDLPEKGIRYHINHLRRLWQAGNFPAPFYPTPRRCSWYEDKIDQWLEGKYGEQQAKIDARQIEPSLRPKERPNAK
jgi:hypothetical protein